MSVKSANDIDIGRLVDHVSFPTGENPQFQGITVPFAPTDQVSDESRLGFLALSEKGPTRGAVDSTLHP